MFIKMFHMGKANILVKFGVSYEWTMAAFKSAINVVKSTRR